MTSINDWGNLQLLLAVGVPVLIAAVALIWIGLRGRHAWASPYCRKCKYDLRGRVPEETPACPECGCNLERKRAIGYVRHRPRWSLVALGIFVLLSPGLVWAGFVGFERARQKATAVAGVNAVVNSINASELPNQSDDIVLAWTEAKPDQSAGWDELKARIQGGTLSNADAIAAIDLLIEYMNHAHVPGSRMSLYQQEGFLSAVYAADLVDDERMRGVTEAFYGQFPVIQIERVRSYQRSEVEIDYARDLRFQAYEELPWRVVWDLHPVKIGQNTAETSNFRRYSSDMRFYLNPIRPDLLEAGGHDVIFKLEIGLFDQEDLIGYDEEKTRLKDWPPARVRWIQEVVEKLVIYDRDHPPVTLTTETSNKPSASHFRIDHVVARYETGIRYRSSLEDRFSREADTDTQKPRVFLKITAVSAIDIPLSMSAALHIGKDRVGLDPLTFTNSADSKIEWEIEGDASRVRDWDAPAKLVLTPDPAHLFSDSTVDRCWGEPIVIEGIKVKTLFQDSPEAINTDTPD